MSNPVGARGIGDTQQYERDFAMVRQSRDPGVPVIPVLLPGCQKLPTGFLELMTWVDLRGASTVLDQPAELESLLGVVSCQESISATVRNSVCPYLGLEPFAEEDAAFFSGRDRAVAEALIRA